jgi:muramoyltetrapeptide carboxypeptidase LdcA involved in peptidoglycan recycling
VSPSNNSDWIRPLRLSPGDTVAVVSPSWGGPAAFPEVYEAGLRTLEGLGLRVRETTHVRAANATVEQRVADLRSALLDPTIKMIVASIGGDDAVRLLKHFSGMTLRANAKIVMGFSDTAAILTHMATAGVVSFHGPSVMAGLAQASQMPHGFLEVLAAVLFGQGSGLVYPSFGSYTSGGDWQAGATAVQPFAPDDGLRFLAGERVVRGRLLGGCLEVLEMVKGTPSWPPRERWQGAILMIEGSEEKPSPASYRRALRSWAAAGLLDGVVALLVGRPHATDAAGREALDDEMLAFVREELGREDLVLVTNVPVGHTDPQWVVPIGGWLEVDPGSGTITLLESPVV